VLKRQAGAIRRGTRTTDFPPVGLVDEDAGANNRYEEQDGGQDQDGS
jgi:hypothetical protein